MRFVVILFFVAAGMSPLKIALLERAAYIVHQ